MKRRDIIVCLILSVVTCGIYGWYWMYCVTEEIGEASGDKSISGGMAVFLTLVSCTFFGIYWAYKMGELLEKAKFERGESVTSSDLPILYLILQIIELLFVNLALMQNELNKLQQ